MADLNLEHVTPMELAKLKQSVKNSNMSLVKFFDSLSAEYPEVFGGWSVKMSSNCQIACTEVSLVPFMTDVKATDFIFAGFSIASPVFQLYIDNLLN